MLRKKKDEEILNPDFYDEKEETKKRRRKTKAALDEIEEKIEEVDYAGLMKKSYLDYSMSVITQRALPDCRDGLKPVQRRIVYDMQQLGTTSDKPYRKSARIVGDAMGKYHPHGDSSIYGAMVNMAQDFRNNACMVDGHGNFGSIEGDGAAAMRYTESRMTGYTEDVFLSYIKEDTVDLIPNYDETEREPAILPALLPNLLINGSEGIAVGMATSIPQHNLGEVADAAVYFIDHEDADSKDLMKHLPGPDFPTGGIVANKDELLQIYETGTGKIRLRGKVSFEKDKGGRERIVITEIPYTMVGEGIGRFLSQAASLVENRTITDIVDISNQSSKEGIRIVFDLKKGADKDKILNILYKKTKLEDTMAFNLLAIKDGKPETLSLPDVFRAFLAFQEEIYTRRFRFLKDKAGRKEEIDEGLLKAIDVLDVIIEVIRGSRTVKTARDCLMYGRTNDVKCSTKSAKIAKDFCFSELQANAILDLRLQRLVGLEIDVIREDLEKTRKDIRRYDKLLKSRTELKKEIKKTILELKEKYAVPRKTLLVQEDAAVVEEEPEQIIPVTVLIDRFYYIRSLDPAMYEKNKEQLDEQSRYVIQAKTDQKLILFTKKGKAHTVKIKDVPFGKTKDKGIPIEHLTGYLEKDDEIINILLLEEGEWIFVSSDGYVKRVLTAEFDVTRRMIDATKLSDGATLHCVLPFTGDTLQLTSKKGFRIRFRQEDAPLQGKTARGAIGMKMDDGDTIVDVTTESRMHITKRGGKGKK